MRRIEVADSGDGLIHVDDGNPQAIRADNGPENVSGLLQQWAEKHKITLCYIQPGKPQQNAYIERFNRPVRHEWLGTNVFFTIEEVQDHETKWLWTYNNDRPKAVPTGSRRAAPMSGYSQQPHKFYG